MKKRITTKRQMTIVANKIERELKEVASIFTSSEFKMTKYLGKDFGDVGIYSNSVWMMTQPVIEQLIKAVSPYTGLYDDVYFSFCTYPYKQTEDGDWLYTPCFNVAIRMQDK